MKNFSPFQPNLGLRFYVLPLLNTIAGEKNWEKIEKRGSIKVATAGTFTALATTMIRII